MINFDQKGVVEESRTNNNTNTSFGSIDDQFWDQSNVEENLRNRLNEFAGEFQRIKQQRETY